MNTKKLYTQCPIIIAFIVFLSMVTFTQSAYADIAQNPFNEGVSSSIFIVELFFVILALVLIIKFVCELVIKAFKIKMPNGDDIIIPSKYTLMTILIISLNYTLYLFFQLSPVILLLNTMCIICFIILINGVNRVLFHRKVLNDRINKEKYIILTPFILIILLGFLLLLSINSYQKDQKDYEYLSSCEELLQRGVAASNDLSIHEIKRPNTKTNQQQLHICENKLKKIDQNSPAKTFKVPVEQEYIGFLSSFNLHLLENGKLLIYNYDLPDNSEPKVSLFNPKTNNLEHITDKRDDRKRKFNNRDLCFDSLPNKQIYVGVGVFDPKNNVLSSATDQVKNLMENVQNNSTYTLSNMKALVASNPAFLDPVNRHGYLGYQRLQYIDLINNKTLSKVKFNVSRDGFNVVALEDGQLLIVGGSHNEKLVNTIELYNPKANKIKIVAKIKYTTASNSFSIRLNDGRVLIILNGKKGTMLEIFNPEDRSVKLAGKTKLPISTSPYSIDPSAFWFFRKICG